MLGRVICPESLIDIRKSCVVCSGTGKIPYPAAVDEDWRYSAKVVVLILLIDCPECHGKGWRIPSIPR